MALRFGQDYACQAADMPVSIGRFRGDFLPKKQNRKGEFNKIFCRSPRLPNNDTITNSLRRDSRGVWGGVSVLQLSGVRA
jgi:hypothetical protein